MAIFGADFYGTVTYGEPLAVQYDVSPFVAVPVDYALNQVSWTNPSNTYSHFRLLRSTNGPAVRQDEGALLGDDTTLSGTTFMDDTAVPDVVYYYTLFFEDGSNNWWSAGATACLTVGNHGYTERLYNWIPRYYRFPTDQPTDLQGNTENAYLFNFMKPFGWGFDLVKTYYDNLLHLNDTQQTGIDNLRRLADQFGIPFEYASSVRNMRKYVSEWSTLMRRKGTTQGLSDIITAATGWQADILPGRNMMLDEDQASFVSPSYPEWDSGFAYQTGDRVINSGFLFQALSAAYGVAQAPPSSATNNTWWQNVSNTSDSTTINPATGNPGTWQSINSDTLAPLGASAIQLGVGFQSPVDNTVNYANALQTKYTGTAVNLALRSVSYLTGQSTMDAYQPILDGVPLPLITETYDSTVRYNPGDMVTYVGYCYQALIATQGVSPSGSTSANSSWQCLGRDKQYAVTFSAYAHTADFTGTNASLPTAPFIEFYDNKGALIVRVFVIGNGVTAWDPFNYPWGALNGQTTSYGGLTWSTLVGSFNKFNGLNGCVSPVDQTTRSFSVVDATTANGNVYITFRSSISSGSLSQALILRATDANNYVKATRSQLIAVSAGTPTILATYTSPAGDNDRLKVNLNGTSYKVYVNNVQVATATSSVNSTATKFGIAVE